MRIGSRISTFALTIAVIAAFSGCAAERAVAPHPTNGVASMVAPAPTDVPLLYVVDGVRLERDQVPSLTGDQIASVRVVKGRAALRDYGPDASYGVVLIRTKAASAPRT